MLQNLLSFTLLAALLTMLPGLDTAQVLRSVAIGGYKSAYATLAGILVGVWIWGMAAALGLSALLVASHLAFTIVKIAGGIYLLYLGIRILIESRNITESTIRDRAGKNVSNRSAFFRALTINLTNPKTGVFYIAILPQFLPHEFPAVIGGLILSTIHNLLGLIWFSLLIFGSSFAKEKLQRPKAQKIIERVSGVALLAFGLRVFAEK